MLAIGYTGTAAAPTSLVLAFPGHVDEGGQAVTAGSTRCRPRPPSRVCYRSCGRPGRTFERTFAWGAKEPSTVMVIEPYVVEVEADTSVTHGVLRHGARLRRPRPDLDPAEA